jgi:hypothetical protein
MKQRMVVTCCNANGSPDHFFFIMDNLPEMDYSDGLHYNAAVNYADSEGYDVSNHVCFDESDMAKVFEDIFVWESATTIDYHEWK